MPTLTEMILDLLGVDASGSDIAGPEAQSAVAEQQKAKKRKKAEMATVEDVGGARLPSPPIPKSEEDVLNQMLSSPRGARYGR